MDPYSLALKSYHNGNVSAEFKITRDDGFCQTVPASVFYPDSNFNELEEVAFKNCHGKVVDVGAGSGRHSLELCRRGFDVCSLDISDVCSAIQEERGLKDVVTADITSWSEQQFDTILMLMNGIGIVKDLDGLSSFLEHAKSILKEGGKILCDSIDVSQTEEPIHVAYRENNIDSGVYKGQQRFVMEGEGESVEFNWLHIDYQTLKEICDQNGWEARAVFEEANGHYLAMLTRK